jgi:hypothetical protein
MAPSSYYWTISFMYLVVVESRRSEVRQEKMSNVAAPPFEVPPEASLLFVEVSRKPLRFSCRDFDKPL